MSRWRAWWWCIRWRAIRRVIGRGVVAEVGWVIMGRVSCGCLGVLEVVSGGHGGLAFLLRLFDLLDEAEGDKDEQSSEDCRYAVRYGKYTVSKG